ncbi:jg3218, partial [Pararge aegeria aegeria]
MALLMRTLHVKYDIEVSEVSYVQHNFEITADFFLEGAPQHKECSPIQRRGNEKKPLSCHFCGFKCKYKSALIRHMRSHTGEKPFACKYCEFKCSNVSTLNLHLRTHTGERPYCCRSCHAKYTRKQHLLVHMRKHT